MQVEDTGEKVVEKDSATEDAPSGGGARRGPTTEASGGIDANLAKLLNDAELKKLASDCLDKYKSDVASRASRMKKLAEYAEYYSGLLRPKSWPWQRCANVNLSLLTYPVLQVHARLFDMVVPEDGRILNAAAADVNDQERARKAELFANFYIRSKMPDYAPGMDDTLAQLVTFGSAFRRTYWDDAQRRICSDWIPIEDMVVPATMRSQDPSMRDVPRVTLVQHFSLLDLEEYADAGVFVNVDKVKPASGDAEDGASPEMQATREKVDGVSRGQQTGDGDDPDAPRIVIEMHRKYRLPKRAKAHPSFDGKAHPVAITIDAESQQVLRMVLREEDDPDDTLRFNQEMQAYQQYLVQDAMYQQQKAQYDAQAEQVAAQGMDPNQFFGPAPVPPQPQPQPAPIRKREFCFFTHYKAFPSEGFYGLGFGDFLQPLAKAGNTIINQFIDGMTLKNARPAFISRQLKIPRGQTAAEPGQFAEVDGPVGALKDGILWLDPPDSDPSTLPVVQMIMTLVEKIAGTGDIASGTTSGANRTAKEVQILNAQMMKQISVLARRVKEANKAELDKIWRALGVYMPEKPQGMQVTGEAGQPMMLEISRDLFRPDARVLPSADPRLRFERVEETQQLYGLVTQNPLTAQNPVVVKAVTEDLLRAMQGEKYVALLEQAQPPPPQPKQPYAEEADWLKGGDPPVLPADDDHAHLNSHHKFYAQAQGSMSPDQKKKAEAHIRFHMGQLHEKHGQAMSGQPQPPTGSPPPQQGGIPQGMPQPQGGTQ